MSATLDDIKSSIDATETALEDAAKGFKQMQIVLLVFCGLVALSISVVAYKIFNDEKNG